MRNFPLAGSRLPCGGMVARGSDSRATVHAYGGRQQSREEWSRRRDQRLPPLIMSAATVRRVHGLVPLGTSPLAFRGDHAPTANQSFILDTSVAVICAQRSSYGDWDVTITHKVGAMVYRHSFPSARAAYYGAYGMARRMRRWL